MASSAPMGRYLYDPIRPHRRFAGGVCPGEANIFIVCSRLFAGETTITLGDCWLLPEALKSWELPETKRSSLRF